MFLWTTLLADVDLSDQDRKNPERESSADQVGLLITPADRRKHECDERKDQEDSAQAHASPLGILSGSTTVSRWIRINRVAVANDRSANRPVARIRHMIVQTP